MNEIFICVLSMTQDTTNTGRNLADKLMQIFLDSTTKEFNILFFHFPLKISHNTGMEMNKNCKVFFQRNLSCPIQIYQ